MNYAKLKTAAVVMLVLMALIQPVKAQFQKINFSGFYLGTLHFPNIDNYHSYEYLQKLDSLRFNMLMGYTSHLISRTGKNITTCIWTVNQTSGRR